MASSTSPVKLWIKLDLGPRGQIGPGKIRLLRTIADTHSIAGAARAMGMSYRRAWLLVEELNEALGTPAVETQVGGKAGGGARLTSKGAELVEGYEKILDKAQGETARELQDFVRLMRR